MRRGEERKKERERDTRDGEKDGREGFCGYTAALYISQINKSF